jgi:CBS domain-containing protein
MENLDTVLAHHPPFDGIDRAELQTLIGGAEEISYETGHAVLVEDGVPARGLWVILTGSMDLVHEGEVIQVLEPGECFGHPSLLTGMAPAFTVRARVPSRCLLFDAQASGRVLGTVAGARYVASTMRGRLTSAGHTVHGLHEVGTTPVSAIMRPPTFIDADSPVREAARRLGEGDTTALLVSLGDGSLGIVSDADVRAGLTEEAVTLDAPVRSIVHTPVPTVPPGQLAIEATIDMLSAGTEHVAVIQGEQVCGLLSAGDLLGLDAHSPIALRHTILGAPDEDALVRAAARLPQLFLLLVRAGVPSRDLGQVLSLQHDAVTARLIDFSLSRSAPAPVAWAWLDMGSAARREFTLASDQDNALAYATPDPGLETEVDAYFEQLGSEVNAGLSRCGIGVDNNGVLAGKRLWRMSKSDWLRTFGEVFQQPDESHLIRASVAFDFRATVGGLDITSELTGIIRDARRHPQFMRLMARTATGYRVALGFRGQLATGREGDPPDRVDIKRGAIIPIVNLVRFHALANGVTISPTLDRIEAVANVGGLDAVEATGLAEAFEVITRFRFDLHAAQISAGAPADNLLDPSELAPIARAELREALNVVRHAQRHLGAWSPPTV